jgi:hypothetical protein
MARAEAGRVGPLNADRCDHLGVPPG